MYNKNTIEQDSKANCIALTKYITMQSTNWDTQKTLRELIEHLNLTKDEKSTLPVDKPFQTSMKRWEKWRPYCACTTTLGNLVRVPRGNIRGSNFMALYIFFLNFYHFLSCTVLRTNFHETKPLFLNRPFCPSVHWHCWLDHIVCTNHSPKWPVVCHQVGH